MIVEVDFKELGLQISKFRHDAHLSQEKLAERVGISPKFMGNIERGVTKPSVNTLFNIGIALELSLGDLLNPSVARIISDQDTHRLRDAAAGYCNTLTSVLLAHQEGENADAENAARFGFLEIDDSYRSNQRP